MNKQSDPIGVFDSGVGGISVLRELVRQMPYEDFLYLGDSLHAPYGTKELEEVIQLTTKNIDLLLSQGAKGIVIACNTATSAAAALLRKKYPQLPLVGIEPAIKPAVKEALCQKKRRDALSKSLSDGENKERYGESLAKADKPVVLVMATPMTLKNTKFQRLMNQYIQEADILPMACPGLMEYVEQGKLTGSELERYLTELFWGTDLKKIDSIVLGCTHYPFVRGMIQKLAGPEVRILDGSEGTAREMRRRLKEANLLHPEGHQGKVHFESSLNTPEELALCKRLLKHEIV